jgi:hypothetical protein
MAKTALEFIRENTQMASFLMRGWIVWLNVLEIIEPSLLVVDEYRFTFGQRGVRLANE